MLDQESDQSNGGYLAECVIEWLKFGLSSTVSSNDRWYGKETDVVNETTKKETDQFCTASWAEIMLPTFERQKEILRVLREVIAFHSFIGPNMFLVVEFHPDELVVKNSTERIL